MNTKSFLLSAAVASIYLVNDSHAQIYRQTYIDLVIPGTEGITPGPGVQLDHRVLAYAVLSSFDLSNANFAGSDLTNANLNSTLTNANLTGAEVRWANFGDTTSHGFTQAQLASTASHQAKKLQGIGLSYNNLTGWDLSGQNLTDARLEFSTLTNANLMTANLSAADFTSSTLTNANLTAAEVRRASFENTTSRGFTQAQLASTASFQAKNLHGITLSSNNLAGWDFGGQILTNAALRDSTLTNANLAKADLTNATFAFSTLTNATLTGAAVTGASFVETTSRGFTQAQLASTASYQAKNLQGIDLWGNDLTGWDFSGQNLTNARLGSSLTNANFTGAVITGAYLDGLTQAQLASTASYQAKNLQGIRLSFESLTAWNFGGQDLTDAYLYSSTLSNANLSGANLTDAVLSFSTLTNANLTGAVVTGAGFGGTTSRGFTQAHLASTASYQAKSLQGMELWGNDLTGWDFSGQNLTDTYFGSATLTNANLTGANLTDAGFESSTMTSANLTGANLTNARIESSTLTSANLTGANLTNADFKSSTLTSANLTGTVVTGADFNDTTSRGFTQAQLASTASYQAKDLQGIGLSSNDLSGWDFSGHNLTDAGLKSSTLTNANLTAANLTDADFTSSTLTNANFSGAMVSGASFADTTSRGFTQALLASTASYQAKNLQGIKLWGNDLTGWDFSGQDLTNASLGSTMTNANLTGAVITGAQVGGLTQAQLVSTASYQAKNLQGIGLYSNDLTGWDFIGQNLTNAVFQGSRLTNANLTGAVVAGADFMLTTSRGFTQAQLASTASYQSKNLQGIKLSSNDLTGWDFDGQDLTGAEFAYYWQPGDFYEPVTSILKNANFRNSVVANAYFSNATSHGFTKEQLYSTASYQVEDLNGIWLDRNDLSGWDFFGQDLTNAHLQYSDLTGANLSAQLTGADLRGAVLLGATLNGVTNGGFSKEQLYSTASYANKDLRGVQLISNDLSGWDFSGQDLTNAQFSLDLADIFSFFSLLTGADFSGSIIKGTSLGLFSRARNGFTREQLYSTASYQQKDLQGIVLDGRDWDFSGQNLSGAKLRLLPGANLVGALIRGTTFAPGGLTKEQLYSTASYQMKDLREIGLSGVVLTAWDFSDQDLSGADLSRSTLTNANLTNANLDDANITWANLDDTSDNGFTKEQLYSTASYKAKRLYGIDFGENDLSGWDFSGQDLSNAAFEGSSLANSNFTGATRTFVKLKRVDTRGAFPRSAFTSFDGPNSILPDGVILGLVLNNDDKLVVRNYLGDPVRGLAPIPVHVRFGIRMSEQGTLRLLFDTDQWESTISLEQGFPANLGGILQLMFAANVDPTTQVGRTFDVFNWNGTLSMPDQFDRIETTTGLWDVSRLYTTGEVTVLAVSPNLTVPSGASYVAVALNIEALTLAGDGSRLAIATVGGSRSVVTNALTIAGTGQLDLTDNDLIVRATPETKDALHAQIQAKISSAQNGVDANFITNWDGPGVTSSFARTANLGTGFDLVGLGVIRNSDLDITTGLTGSSYASFSGQPVTPDDVLVKFTYIGDANLSGAVSFDDYVSIDNAFFGLIPNLGWATGDINFDGVINFDDYSKIDQAFFFQGAPLIGEGSGVAAVPEPATWLLAALASLTALFTWFRRKGGRSSGRA